jgi:hypothetical protein
MTDDDVIRAALRELGRVASGTPPGFVRVSLDELAARQIDRDEAVRWAESHGGHTDRVERRRHGGLGPSYGKREVTVTLILPEEALYR